MTNEEYKAKAPLACGFTHILAPVPDVARDPRMGRYGNPPSFTKGIQKATEADKRSDAVTKR